MELNVSTVSTVSTGKYDFLKNKKKLNIFFSSRVRAIFYWKHWKQSQKKSVFISTMLVAGVSSRAILVETKWKQSGNKTGRDNMTNKQITEKFKRTIDQFFEFPNKGYIEDARLLFIGGVLQSALHILPWDEYWSLKVYCYEKYGYDPGGVTTGQASLFEYEGRGQKWKE